MKRVLITGCSGFLGSYLVERLESGGDYEISGFTEVPEFHSSKLRVFHLDIRDRDSVFNVVETVKPDLVFHLAAIANVGFSWKHQKLTYEVNFIGSSNLLEALAAVVPRCRVLMMSSAELYCASDKPLLDETIPPSAGNPYALSKLAMEMAANLYIESENMDIIKLRSFNFTGPGQDRKFVASDFSHQIVEIEKGLREPVIQVGNLSPVRDVSDVRDTARYLEIIAEKGESGGIYNLCSGNTYSIQQLLDMLLSLSTEEIEVKVDSSKFRPVDVPRLAGDNRLIRDSFGLYPEYKMEQTLSDLLHYWRDIVGENAYTSGNR
jgi:GDP-4-dehydro-6-deoxy-D-mannose reductase